MGCETSYLIFIPDDFNIDNITNTQKQNLEKKMRECEIYRIKYYEEDEIDEDGIPYETSMLAIKIVISKLKNGHDLYLGGESYYNPNINSFVYFYIEVFSPYIIKEIDELEYSGFVYNINNRQVKKFFNY